MNKIAGVVYRRLGRRKAIGLVEPDSNIIHADSKIKGKALLDVLIHEGTHILQPYLTEDAVEHIGVELSNMLWEQGYRKIDMDEVDTNIDPL